MMKLKVVNGYVLNPINIKAKIITNGDKLAYEIYAMDLAGIEHLVTTEIFLEKKDVLDFISKLVKEIDYE